MDIEDLHQYKYSYPELSEEGKAKTKIIIDAFSENLKKVFNDTLYEFTNNISEEIVDDDSWVNIRQKTKDALCGYPITGQIGSVNWVQIRKRILEENRDQVINDIILDKENEIVQLKKTIEQLQELRRGGY